MPPMKSSGFEKEDLLEILLGPRGSKTLLGQNRLSMRHNLGLGCGGQRCRIVSAGNVLFHAPFLYSRWENVMRKFMIQIVFLVCCCCSVSTGALASTQHAIPVDTAHGASRHDVILSPWQEDNWTDGPGIFTALLGLHS